MTVRFRVYIAGPITLGDREENVRKAANAARKLIEVGCYAPLVPHALEKVIPSEEYPWDVWLDVDESWVEVADAVLRLPGRSKGACREERFARSLNIPVFRSIKQLRRHFEGDYKAWEAR